LFSAVSAWEIGLLVARGRIQLAIPIQNWIARFLQRPGILGVPLGIDAAIEATRLPGDAHRDPADRFLIAQARILDAQIVTRDRQILAYAAAGHVRAVAC
jgi:PIN domain nuclease of toxin-antitoxin system